MMIIKFYFLTWLFLPCRNSHSKYTIKVYIVAGGTKDSNTLDSTEILVEGDASWTTVGAVKPWARRGPSIITLNNKVFLMVRFGKQLD